MKIYWFQKKKLLKTKKTMMKDIRLLEIKTNKNTMILTVLAQKMKKMNHPLNRLRVKQNIRNQLSVRNTPRR